MPEGAPHPLVLDARDVSDRLRCSRSTVYELRQSGELPAAFKLFPGERGWRWSLADVERFLEGKRVKEPPEQRPRREAAPKFVPVEVRTAGT
jgi:excisionase family DNA binding protein